MVRLPTKLKKQDNIKAMEVEVGGCKEEGLTKFEKKEIRNIGEGFHKIGVVGTLSLLWCS